MTKLTRRTSAKTLIHKPEVGKYRVVQKAIPLFYFCDNFRKFTPILIIFFTGRTRNLSRLPPDPYCVITLPSKTRTAANIDASCLI